MRIDIVAAARKYLATNPGLFTVLGSDSTWDIWLFQEKLYSRVESSGKTACVLKQLNGWTTPNTYNTARFPRLQTQFFADPDRDSKNNVESPLSAKDKIFAAHAVIDLMLHNVSGQSRFWPSFDDCDAVRVNSSVRSGELDFGPVIDGDGMLQASVTYNLCVG